MRSQIFLDVYLMDTNKFEDVITERVYENERFSRADKWEGGVVALREGEFQFSSEDGQVQDHAFGSVAPEIPQGYKLVGPDWFTWRAPGLWIPMPPLGLRSNFDTLTHYGILRLVRQHRWVDVCRRLQFRHLVLGVK